MKGKFQMYKNLTKDKERKLIELYNETVVSSKEIKVESLKETLLKDSEEYSQDEKWNHVHIMKHRSSNLDSKSIVLKDVIDVPQYNRETLEKLLQSK